MMVSKARLKNFENLKNILFILIIRVNIFSLCLKFFPCVNSEIPCVFPCLEKVRTKFPVVPDPVPWPPWNLLNYD